MTADTVNLPPLPEPQLLGAEVSGHIAEFYGHSDEAMRSYALLAVQEERRQNIRLCEDQLDRYKDAYLWDEVNAVGRCLEAIRSQQP